MIEPIYLPDTDDGLRVLKTTNTSRRTGYVPVTVYSNPELLGRVAVARHRNLAGAA